MTPVADRLEKQGITERRAHPHDRRAKRLALIGILSEDSPLAGLSYKEQKTLQDLLIKAVRCPGGPAFEPASAGRREP
ncbi:hypothetical protein [Nonomuraea sp. NPDC049695]|uniref:hypothetical protein n=1 Tax=Nonomuraea sp. NPDC049695 TaxID=3154734 RepID=UPI0034207C33